MAGPGVARELAAAGQGRCGTGGVAADASARASSGARTSCRGYGRIGGPWSSVDLWTPAGADCTRQRRAWWGVAHMLAHAVLGGGGGARGAVVVGAQGRRALGGEAAAHGEAQVVAGGDLLAQVTGAGGSMQRLQRQAEAEAEAEAASAWVWEAKRK